MYAGSFRGSADYWERRYRRGSTSGTGSFGRLAQFKADFLNSFVKEQQVNSVVEWGCGDGSQLALANYPSYVGIDVSRKAIELCSRRFAADLTKSFYALDEVPPGISADLSVSLDVIYHLVEDAVYEPYMRRLFDAARRFVIVYSSNQDQQTPTAHVRHRQFTLWVRNCMPEWSLTSVTKNPYGMDAEGGDTSFCDFYVFMKAAGHGSESSSLPRST